MVATTQSIDRFAEIFTFDGSSWNREHSSAAPIPLWIGALGTADRLAWLGAEPESGASATVQRLVAGVVEGDTSERGTFTDAVDRNVFTAVPIATPAGVTSTVLLQGLFRRDGDTLTWDHYELIRIDAEWR